MKIFLLLILVLCSLGSYSEESNKDENSLGDIDYDPYRLEDIAYRVTRILVDLPGTIKRYLHGAGHVTDHIKKDFVGFIQANLAIPYSLYAMSHVRWAKILGVPIVPIGLAVLGSGEVEWNRWFQHFGDMTDDVVQPIIKGVEKGLRDSDMGYVVDLIEKALKQSPFKDFEYLNRIINEQLKKLKCTDVFTRAICQLSPLEKKIHRLLLDYNREHFDPDTAETITVVDQHFGKLSNLFFQFTNKRFGNDLDEFVWKTFRKWEEFVKPRYQKVFEGSSTDFSRVPVAQSMKPEYSCDRYTPESVPWLCHIFQRITRLATDFPNTIQIIIHGVTKIAVEFMKSVMDDFPGLIRSRVTPLWGLLFRFPELVNSAVRSTRVEHFISKWFPVAKLLTLLPAMDQARKIFDLYFLLDYNFFMGIKSGLVQSGMGELISLVEKFQHSTVQPFLHFLAGKFQMTKCSDIFPASFCDIPNHRRRMQETWDFVLHGSFAEQANLTRHLFSKAWDDWTVEKRTPKFFRYCVEHERAEDCMAYLNPMNKMTQVGAEAVKDFVEWLIKNI